MKELDRDYRAAFGHWDRAAWDGLLSSFGDANLYQAWSYDNLRYAPRNVSHMVLRRGAAVVATAQVRVIRVEWLRMGIAYVRWGPTWRQREGLLDLEIFRQAVRALRGEFSRRRGLVLRLYPLAYSPGDEGVARILYEEGYRLHDDTREDRTLLLDLDVPMDALRAALDERWRRCLKRAEKSELEVTLGEDEHLFEEIAGMHRQMLARKGPVDAHDIDHLTRVQGDLPEGLKLKAVVCRLGAEPCAGAIFAAMGTSGLYVRGATSDAGLKTNGSYLVQWTIVRWLHENGFLYYDLNGISPDTNPGPYVFKRGLGGKRGREVAFLGRFQVWDSPVCHWVVRGGERFLAGCRRLARAARCPQGPPCGPAPALGPGPGQRGREL